ncbi:MAG: endonuclease III [Clostridia bacterium]|nr:endonuclease III [Clostridia bacterium]
MKKLSEKQKKININEAAKRLEKVYPSAECALKYNGEPWKLLVMGRLSAQCTDARVNIVCEELFARFPTLESLADGELDEIARIVRPCGLFNTKAKNIKDACLMLTENFGGVLPDNMDALLSLPGVGRKIANLLLGDIYGLPSIVADTHCIRICGRLGMYDEKLKDPTKVEKILTKLVLPEYQTDFCHRIVQFGRDTCSARSPKCDGCVLSDICLHNSDKE